MLNKNLLENIIYIASREAQKKNLSEIKFEQIKRQVLKNQKIKNIPLNTALLSVYHNLAKSKKITQDPILEEILRKKKIRSLSGIASITVITPDFSCPGKCIYCPTEKGMPKSYLSNEPAVMRAIANNFNPYKQVSSRLKMLRAQGHPTDKIELIIAGGTWSYIPELFQAWFVKECFRAANKKSEKQKVNSEKFNKNTKLKNLLEKLSVEQKKNEIAENRIIGLTLETRPDWINKEEIKKMRNYGCTRVELGVQSIYDDVLRKCGRGHGVKETILATKLLKNAGFKINYHIMLGLPGSNPKRDKKMLEELFVNSDFQPDMLKIYPCVVLKRTPLYKLYKSGKYKPYSDKQIINILKNAKTKIPEYCRIVRVIRDIPTQSIEAGGKISNLREVIHQEMAKEGKQCRCIRCREIKNLKINSKTLKLKRLDYAASDGQEIFLSFEDIKNDKLAALLRMRIPYCKTLGTEGMSSERICDHFWHGPGTFCKMCRAKISRASEVVAGQQRMSEKDISSNPQNSILQILNDSAIIREVHIYGQMEKIGAEGGKAQHLGLGKKLIQEAEKIAKKEFGLSKIAVISGIGARNYYRKLGYKLKDTYLIKPFSF